MIGFGIIGCGMVAGIHAMAISEIKTASLVGAFDSHADAAEAFAAKHGCEHFETAEEMLTRSDIDIICICTPSFMHAPYAVMCLQGGKNVIVEKPMALNVEDCRRVIAAEKASGKTCAVVSQLLHADDTRLAKQLIAEGRLGRITEFGLHMKYHRNKEYYTASPWHGTWEKDGGGALMNQGIHGVDMLIAMLGMPESVYAVCKTLCHDIETEDTAAALLEYASGTVGVIEATTSVSPGYPRTMEICGTRGSITFEEDMIKRLDVEGVSHTPAASHGVGFADPAAISCAGHKKVIEDMIHALQSGRAPLFDAEAGKNSVALIKAIYRSSQTGKKVYLNENTEA